LHSPRTKACSAGSGPIRADALVASLPRWAWQQLSAGPGAKGERFYDWAWITLTPNPARSADTDSGCWWLLVRRNQTTGGELAFYRCYCPQRRWTPSVLQRQQWCPARNDRRSAEASTTVVVPSVCDQVSSRRRSLR
jgi:hypothetical protein